MSLHNFNPNNKSWKMYSNTLTSISGDNLTVKPYDGRNLLLEVSANNNIFFKRGDISYGLDDLIGGGNSNIILTSVSGDIIPYITNTFNLGDVSKNWRNAYIRDLSVSNISVSGTVSGITKAMVGLTNVDNTTDANKPVSTATQTALDLKANLASPTFSGTITIPSSVSILSNSVTVTSAQLAFVSGATRNIQTQLTELSNNKVNSANPTFTGTVTLPANSINSTHIQNRTILGEDISTGTIDLSNLSTSAITSLQTTPAISINSSHIIDGSILGTDISSATITAFNIANETITKFQIASGTITGSQIGSSTITGSNIAVETITSSNIVDGAITEAKFSSELQTILGEFADRLLALEIGITKPHGIFEIVNDQNSGGEFFVTMSYYDDDKQETVYLFQGEQVGVNEIKYIPYILPNNFAVIEFTLYVDGYGLDLISYTLPKSPSHENGIAADSQDQNSIFFGILRNYHQYIIIFLTLDTYNS
jgi:hypothetical protein